MVAKTRTNICFHGIGTPERDLEPGEQPYWISVDFYQVVLDQVMGRDDIHLSFDDGNVSDVMVGLPGLLDRGLTATFFALAGRLGQAGSLSAENLRHLVSQGMTVGSHGMSHVPWRGLKQTDRMKELVVARELLEDAAGVQIDEAALPLGRYDRQVLSALRSAGYRRVYTSDRLPAAPDRWMQPRYSVTEADTLDTVKTFILAPRTLRGTLLPRVSSLVKRLR